MKIYEKRDGNIVEVNKLSGVRSRQAAAVVDCIGRLIPHEGIDYDIEITFSNQNSDSVSMGIRPHTDKGEWWRRYVIEMIKKYPPTVETPKRSLIESAELPVESSTNDGGAK